MNMRRTIDRQNQHEAWQDDAERGEVFAVPSLEQRSRSAHLLKLQQSHGNQFVQRLLNLQRQSDGPSASSEAPPQVYQALRSPGQPLDHSTKDFFESSFGHDFSDVRVHTDSQASESAESVNAVAYTVGQDVVFGAGQYAPETEGGKGLLAHELAHVVQQGAGRGGGGISEKLEVGEADDEYEREADLVAQQVMRRASQPDAESSSTNISEALPFSTNHSGAARKVSRQTPGAGADKSPAVAPPPAPPVTQTEMGPAKASAEVPKATEAKPADEKAETKPGEAPKAEAASIKSALDSIQVVQETKEELLVQPQVMFKLMPANTEAKKNAFNAVLSAVRDLRRAERLVANKKITEASQVFQNAQAALTNAIDKVRLLLLAHLESGDAELKTAQQHVKDAEAALAALNKPESKADPKAIAVAEAELKKAQEALDAREKALADLAEKSATGRAPTKRNYYSITVDGEKINLYDHVEAYATIYEKGLEASAASEKEGTVTDMVGKSGLSESRMKILKAISSYEGGFTSTQSWDVAVYTWGFVQWTGGDNSDLTAALSIIKEQAPEAFAKRFQKYGIDVDAKKKQLLITEDNGPATPATDKSKPAAKPKQTRGNAAAKALQESPKLTAVMSRAGLDPDIQLAEIKAANEIEINKPLNLKVEVLATPKPPPAPEAKPEAKAETKTEAKTEAKKGEGKKASKEKKKEVKKLPPVKVSVRVGDVFTSEYGVGLIANRVVHAGYYGTKSILEKGIKKYVADKALAPEDFSDPDRMMAWVPYAEAELRPKLVEDKSRAEGFIKAGCSTDPFTFEHKAPASGEELDIEGLPGEAEGLPA
jgi:hypothetical protein